MYAFSTALRLMIVLTGAVVPWLLLASVATASPVHVAKKTKYLSCQARHARAALARLSHLNPSRRKIRRHLLPVLHRAVSRPHQTDDDEAIQTDGPAVGISEHTRPPAVLDAAGVLAAAHISLRTPPRFSRSSPRGPPTFT